MFAYAYTFLTALVVTFLLTPAVKRFALKIGAVDKPNARKVHHGLIPRLGGLAIYAGFMVSILCTVGISFEMVGIMLGATVLVLVGVVDDVYSLPAKVKLLGQIFSAAIVVIGFGIHIDWLVLPMAGLIYLPALISIPLTIFWIIGFINTVNLIDGLDGLAAGVAAIASVAIAMLALQFQPGKDFHGGHRIYVSRIYHCCGVRTGGYEDSGGRCAVCSPYCPYGADYGYAYGYCPKKTERYSNFCTG